MSNVRRRGQGFEFGGPDDDDRYFYVIARRGDTERLEFLEEVLRLYQKEFEDDAFTRQLAVFKAVTNTLRKDYSISQSSQIFEASLNESGFKVVPNE